MTETNPNHLYIKAVLTCGAGIEIVQRERNMNLEIILAPKEGTDIAGTAAIKDNKLHVYATVESVAGMYQLLDLMIRPKKRKFLGLF